jgi:hypothetical protein
MNMKFMLLQAERATDNYLKSGISRFLNFLI